MVSEKDTLPSYNVELGGSTNSSPYSDCTNASCNEKEINGKKLPLRPEAAVTRTFIIQGWDDGAKINHAGPPLRCKECGRVIDWVTEVDDNETKPARRFNVNRALAAIMVLSMTMILASVLCFALMPQYKDRRAEAAERLKEATHKTGKFFFDLTQKKLAEKLAGKAEDGNATTD